jgi:hypothetical protein
MKRPFTLTIIFIIGCATGGVASQFAVPQVRAGTSPTRWEYFCISSKPGTLNEDLSRMGAQGWELATSFIGQYAGGGRIESLTADTMGFCFKRALP